MPYIERAAYCPYQEYAAWEPTRVQADALVIDDIYMAMFALGQSVGCFDALKCPTRVLETNKVEGRDLHIVTLAILDDELKVELTTGAGCFQDGKWVSAATEQSDLWVNDVSIREMYFRGADDGIAGPWEDLADALEAHEAQATLCRSYV